LHDALRSALAGLPEDLLGDAVGLSFGIEDGAQEVGAALLGGTDDGALELVAHETQRVALPVLGEVVAERVRIVRAPVVPVLGHVGAEVRVEAALPRSEEHTSELQSRENLVCRLL